MNGATGFCVNCKPVNPVIIAHTHHTGGRERAADPVSLHQEYKKAWQKLNLPGETSHSKLRWAVRGWMMGEEPT